ncbi:hypothetical protein H5410_001987 [Solanum commersonii]|uniref:Uncharacterized protein n=1 Tax=Solanum commersonii TaxID=4109 RepID=A0A9J6B0L4_SOLCO|nr:hypothetical protein H5410_001987 [Solanum commersonii]
MSIYCFKKSILQWTIPRHKSKSLIYSAIRLWCSSSPFCTILRHHHVLELLGDALTAPFFGRLDPFLQGSAHWNKRRSDTLRRLAKWTRRSSGLHFFVLFSLFIPFCDQTQVQPFKKGLSNSATQDSIMNTHMKTQFIYARINCVLKDSSCDTPLPKILMLTILSSNASSSSTIVFKSPHRNDDSIFTQWFTIKSFRIRCNAHSHKEEHNAYFHP